MSRCWVRVCGVRRVTPQASLSPGPYSYLLPFTPCGPFLSVRLFVCQLRRSMILATYGLTNRVSRREKTIGTGRGRCQHSSARRASRTTTPAGTLMDTLHMTAHFIFLIPTSPLPLIIPADVRISTLLITFINLHIISSCHILAFLLRGSPCIAVATFPPILEPVAPSFTQRVGQGLGWFRLNS